MKIICPYCDCENTFEQRYHGAYPHLYSYVCTECGVSGPVASGNSKEFAKTSAHNELMNFLRKVGTMESYGELNLDEMQNLKKAIDTERHSISRQFTYQSPNAEQVESMKQIREQAKALAHTIYHLCPTSSDRDVAVQKLRESVMFANASIVLE